MKLKNLFPFIMIGIIVIALSGKWRPLPRLGSFFSPESGWTNQNKTENRKRPKVLKDQLKGKATIHFDSLGVPYIFADVEQDVYLLQGYITARDRLFQMEAASRLTAGRLAEWMGTRMVENDRYFRRLGLSEAAKRATDLALSDPETKLALESYAEGVNLFISNLDKKDYPLEYKLLDVEPELWTPEKTILILKNITYTLTGYFDDYQKTNARNVLGIEFIQEILFKDFQEI
ncbi:MAG: penicillin acylase family protein, partial [Bacteroidetes bacterium]|nr:penicillin acylase family protein [Bacteroidota bacterium]